MPPPDSTRSASSSPRVVAWAAARRPPAGRPLCRRARRGAPPSGAGHRTSLLRARRPAGRSLRQCRPGTNARRRPLAGQPMSSMAPSIPRARVSSVRHSTARAPWATWGSMTSVRRGRRIGSGARPRRSSAASTMTIAPRSRDPPEARADVAAQAVEMQVRPQVSQLSAAALAARSDDGTDGEVGQTTTDQHVPRVGALGHGREAEAGGRHGLEVLGRMHGRVRLARRARRLAPRARTHPGPPISQTGTFGLRSPVVVTVTSSTSSPGCACLHQRGHVACLPERERAASGGQAEPERSGPEVEAGPGTRPRAPRPLPCRLRPSVAPSARAGAWRRSAWS